MKQYINTSVSMFKVR